MIKYLLKLRNDYFNFLLRRRYKKYDYIDTRILGKIDHVYDDNMTLIINVLLYKGGTTHIVSKIKNINEKYINTILDIDYYYIKALPIDKLSDENIIKAGTHNIYFTKDIIYDMVKTDYSRALRLVTETLIKTYTINGVFIPSMDYFKNIDFYYSVVVKLKTHYNTTPINMPVNILYKIKDLKKYIKCDIFMEHVKQTSPDSYKKLQTIINLKKIIEC